MEITAVHLRWYRSFNLSALGPDDKEPTAPWHKCADRVYPFVSVPLEDSITTIVGANESGKSHLLSAIAKAFKGRSADGKAADEYGIKDICRYCEFDGLDDTVWPEIGIDLTFGANEAVPFAEVEEEEADDEDDSDGDECKDDDTGSSDGGSTVQVAPAAKTPVRRGGKYTVIISGAAGQKYARVYREDEQQFSYSREQWDVIASSHLPDVELLDARLVLPGEIHVDELLELLTNPAQGELSKVVDPLKVQDLWKKIKDVEVVQGKAPDANTAARIDQLKKSIETDARGLDDNERRLSLLLFRDVIGIDVEDVKRIRKYSSDERGFVSRLVREINSRIESELDISRYWDQDEDFRLSVEYKAGTFYFQITDRTGSVYTFNERSSGLRYFLSYYIQAKALEKANHARGVMILMDEPDSYLSAAGQRSLLRVFDVLVAQKRKSAPCQLVYTTHSPFLINKNHPGRIRLVRKGDGSEGTQYVARGAVHRFEPVRSALSIDASETLFLGSTNVVVEGNADQKLLVGLIQRFGVPGKMVEVLDLNAVVIVSADGAPKTPGLVRKSLTGDEKPPVVVVLLDGDATGQKYAQETSQIIPSKQVTTLEQITGTSRGLVTIEDIVPASLWHQAVNRLLGDIGEKPLNASLVIPDAKRSDKVLLEYIRSNCVCFKDWSDVAVRSAVIDQVVELLLNAKSLPEEELLRKNALAIFARLNQMIEEARRVTGQASLRKLARQAVTVFKRSYRDRLTKADLRRWLDDLAGKIAQRGEDAEKMRRNIDALHQEVDAEAHENSDQLDLERWTERLSRFQYEPWARFGKKPLQSVRTINERSNATNGSATGQENGPTAAAGSTN